MPEARAVTHPASEPVPPAAADDVVLRRTPGRRSSGPRTGRPDASATATSSLELSRELLIAISRLQAPQVSATLDRSLIGLGLHRTVEEVLLPSMREVGTRWARGQCNTEEEQLATGTVRSWLRQRVRETPPPLHETPVVLTCGPLDRHTIALETFHVLLAHARFDCLNLGSQVLPTALATAIDTCSAQAVVLVSHLGRNRAAAVSALHAVKDSSASLFYAGAAFRTAATRQRVPGHYLGGNLTDAAAHLRTQLRTTG
jgi:MerR family transcriptional regulator, light-induced transcriptional regulator